MTAALGTALARKVFAAHHFHDWYESLQEKAGQRIDRDAARFLFDQGSSIMDAVVRLTNRSK